MIFLKRYKKYCSKYFQLNDYSVDDNEFPDNWNKLQNTISAVVSINDLCYGYFIYQDREYIKIGFMHRSIENYCIRLKRQIDDIYDVQHMSDYQHITYDNDGDFYYSFRYRITYNYSDSCYDVIFNTDTLEYNTGVCQVGKFRLNVNRYLMPIHAFKIEITYEDGNLEYKAYSDMISIDCGRIAKRNFE